VLGHIQRGGSPTARDRVLGTRYGVFAADLVKEGRWGTMAALHGDTIVSVSLEEATKELHLIDPKLYELAEVFFG
jgi:6-phosphofructokinase 1